jgi:hypothetical protein
VLHGVPVHEQIDVAVRTVVATRDGAEHSKVARAVLRRYPEDVVTFLPQIHGRIVLPHKKSKAFTRNPRPSAERLHSGNRAAS